MHAGAVISLDRHRALPEARDVEFFAATDRQDMLGLWRWLDRPDRLRVDLEWLSRPALPASMPTAGKGTDLYLL